MSDDKTKRGRPDRDLFNKHEPYEVDHAVKQIAREFPNQTKTAVKKAILDSAKVKNFHNNRDMILNSARIKLKHSK
jgi:hypothetical protein